MGINARNIDYVFPNNMRRDYPFADDKVLTKEVAGIVGIPTPELYGIIAFQNQAKNLAAIVEGRSAFVVKPARGSGGEGILVIREKTEGGYRKGSGEIVRPNDMRYHIQNILSGMYSMGGQSDKAIVEYAVEFDPVFEEITYQGVPDIRIIVYHGVPAMAMLRLPTRASDGKANLHGGGIGVGIDLSSGLTKGGVQGTHFTDRHPETGKPIAGRRIPHWRRILEMAARFYEATALGYLGVDMVLDKNLGPLLLEINARPGLAIQIANRKGLHAPLAAIDQALPSFSTVAEKVNFAQEQL